MIEHVQTRDVVRRHVYVLSIVHRRDIVRVFNDRHARVIARMCHFVSRCQRSTRERARVLRRNIIIHENTRRETYFSDLRLSFRIGVGAAKPQG
jgi:hypothetical protein